MVSSVGSGGYKSTVNKKKLVSVLSDWHFGGDVGTNWYVRPSGGSYGTEDGTSYANAWDGFANIDTSVIMSGDTVYIAGTHNEFLTASKIVNGVSYVSLIADPATLSGQDARNICADCTSKSNVTFTDIIFSDAVVSCLNIDSSTNIITNDCTFSGSGNQGIQHLGVTTATHNNPTCSDNVDDGISAHDSAVITVNGGTFTTNSEALAVIATVTLTMNGPFTFSGNTNDLSAFSTSLITVNDTTFNAITNVGNGANVIFNDCSMAALTITPSAGAAATVVFNDCILTAFTNTQASTITFNNCLVKVRVSGNNSSVITWNYCRYMLPTGSAGTGQLGNHTFNWCLIDGLNASDHLLAYGVGARIKMRYCVATRIPSAKYGLVIFSASVALVDIQNVDFVGIANVGNGIFSKTNHTMYNCIFTDLSVGANQTSEALTLENCCFFDCTTAKSGSPTSNDEVTGDPKLLNVAGFDYNLDVGSSCLGTGETRTDDDAIDTANWGDGSTTVPVVVTAVQAASWNIGAYV